MRNTSTNGSVARAYFFGMLLIALLLAAFSLFQPLDQRNVKLSNSEQLTATEVELTPDKTSSFSDAVKWTPPSRQIFSQFKIEACLHYS
ncbi:MAG: hypothetical protein ABL919_02305 [Methylococcales bacterium]